MQKCPNCGVESADDAVHCGGCGKSLKAEPPAVAGGAAAGGVPKRTMMGVAAMQGPALEKAIADAKAAMAAQQAAKAAGQTGQAAPPATAPRKPAATMLGFAAIKASEVKPPTPAPTPAKEDDWGTGGADDAESWEAPGPVKPAPVGAKPIGMGTGSVPVKAAHQKTVMFDSSPTEPPAPAKPAATAPSKMAKTVMFDSSPTEAPAPAKPAATPASPAKTVMFESAPTEAPAPAAPAAKPAAGLAKTVMFESAPTDAPAPAAPAKPAAAGAPSGLAKTMLFEASPSDLPPAPAATPPPGQPTTRSRAAGTLPPQLARTAIMDAVDDGTADKVIGQVAKDPATKVETPRTVPPSSLAATIVGGGSPIAPSSSELPRTPTPSPKPAPTAPVRVAPVAEPERPSVPDPLEPDRRLVRRACMVLGALLVGLYFVPLGGGAMAWHALAAAHGAGKLFAIWMPIAGAILLIAGLAPMGYALRAGIATVAGLVPLVGSGAGHGLPATLHGVRGVLLLVGVVALAAGCLLRARFHGAALSRVVVAIAALLLLGLLFVPSRGQIALFAGMRAGGAAMAASLVLAALLVLVLLSGLAFLRGDSSAGAGIWGRGLVAWLPVAALVAALGVEDAPMIGTVVGTAATAAYGFVASFGLYQVLASMQTTG